MPMVHTFVILPSLSIFVPVVSLEVLHYHLGEEEETDLRMVLCGLQTSHESRHQHYNLCVRYL